MLHKLIEAIFQVNSSNINLSLFPLRWKVFQSTTDITEDLLSVEYVQFPSSAYTVINNSVTNNTALVLGTLAYTVSDILTFKLYDSEGTLWFSVSANISGLEDSELSLATGTFTLSLATSNWLGNVLLNIVFKQTIPTLPSFYKLQLIKEDLGNFGSAFELNPSTWSFASLLADGNYELVYGSSLFTTATSKQKIVSAKLLTNTNQLVADLASFSYFYTFTNNVLDIEVRNISMIVSSHLETTSLFEDSSLYKCYLDFDYNYADRTNNLALSEIAGSFNSVLKQSGISAIELDAVSLEYSNLNLSSDFYLYYEFRLKSSFTNTNILNITDVIRLNINSTNLEIYFKNILLVTLSINSNINYKLVIYKLGNNLFYKLNNISNTINLVDSSINELTMYDLVFSNNQLVSKFFLAEVELAGFISAYNLYSFTSYILASNDLLSWVKYFS